MTCAEEKFCPHCKQQMGNLCLVPKALYHFILNRKYHVLCEDYFYCPSLLNIFNHKDILYWWILQCTVQMYFLWSVWKHFFFFITLDNALLHCEFYIDCYCSDAPRLLAVWNRICSVRNIKFCLVFVTCISAHKSFHFSESSGTLQSKINRLLGPSMLNLKVSAVSLLISVELQWVARTNSTWNLLKSH